MKTIIISILFMLFANTCFAQPIPADSLYLGQTTPGYTPKVFELPVNGTMRPVERIAITSDGKEIYFCEINSYPAEAQRIKYYKYLNDKWQGPFVAFEGFMDPALSVNDSIMYMETNINRFATAYYSVRNSAGWSVPLKCLSTLEHTHYFQETNLKNYYLSATFTGLVSKDLGYLQISGADTSIKNLGKPINTDMDENDFFVARDESYMIHARSSTSVAGDLYISYKKPNGNWTNSKSLGPQVNLPGSNWEFGCYVTADNKYLFFTRGGIAWPSYYVYWARIDNLIDSLKHTNFAPYLKTQIPNQMDTAGTSYSYTFADTTFIDDDGNNTLTYSAALSSGNPLPSWLNFDPGTRTFGSTSTTAGTLSIKVTATDTANSTASCTFTIDVAQQIGIEPINEQIPTELKLLQNYPNPFNPSTSIAFDISRASHAKLVVYDINGREIQTLVNEMLRAGSYKVSLNGENLSSGIYFYTLATNSITQTKKMILLK